MSTTDQPPAVYSNGRLPPGTKRAKLHAKTHIPTSPEKRRMNQMMHYRALIDAEEQMRADEYARKYELDVPITTLEDDLLGPEPVIPAPATSDDPPAPPVKHEFAPTGWPENARAVVWTTCPNPKLVVIRLPDGRTASLWREGLPTRPVGIECDVHIEKRTGDPIYRLDTIAPIVTIRT